MDKVKSKKTKVKDIISMQIVNPYSAGIDIGDKELVVAIPEGLAEPRVRTLRLHDLRSRRDCGIFKNL